MRILFMGTPVFAREILMALCQNGYPVCAVVSQPDKPQGRHMRLFPTPVKECACAQSIEVYQPETLKDESILPFLERVNPDLIVVAAYGKILPESVLNFPRHKAVNVHASLLPKYRGAAPIQRAIMNGDDETGVSIMYMAKGLDTGDVILKETLPILPDDTAQTLHDRLAKLGGEALVKAVRRFERGDFSSEPQNEADATYAPKLTKAEGRIDWSKDAAQIRNLIRAFNPWPMAHTTYQGQTFIFPSAEIEDKTGRAGEILSAGKGGLVVACGKGALRFSDIKASGKRMMNACDYCQGNCLPVGEVLGGGD